jgi:dimeric dUTPase (all-alpha-NTP-PPase superfamily)
MLALQEKLNERTKESWRDSNFEWYRAIWVECAELLDHYGWKWWKSQEPDMPQVQLEIIDIWHFVMSDYLQKSEDRYIINSAAMAYYHSKSAGFLRKSIENVAYNALAFKKANFQNFFDLLFEAQMDFDDLFKGYIGKNVLNFFRQDHGYNEGTYIKTWNGKEDNVHLVELSDTLDSDSENFQGDLYQLLETTYKGVENA